MRKTPRRVRPGLPLISPNTRRASFSRKRMAMMEQPYATAPLNITMGSLGRIEMGAHRRAEPSPSSTAEGSEKN